MGDAAGEHRPACDGRSRLVAKLLAVQLFPLIPASSLCPWLCGAEEDGLSSEVQALEVVFEIAEPRGGQCLLMPFGEKRRVPVAWGWFREC